MAWDPRQYLKFAGPRVRPGLDLLERIPDIPAKQIVDLGCGAGQLTAQLAGRWLDAQVTGVDSSADMLRQASEAFPAADWPRLTWREGDIDSWQADTAPDLIYSNAALHWLKRHDALFPNLLSQLAPGGVLAVQMPRNFDQPSHLLLHETLQKQGLSNRVGLEARPVKPPADYYEFLSPGAVSLDIWETQYLQVLSGEHPVLDWVKGAALRPVYDALSGADLEAFLADYGAALAEAYPKQSDGMTLFPFRRLFIIARR